MAIPLLSQLRYRLLLVALAIILVFFFLQQLTGANIEHVWHSRIKASTTEPLPTPTTTQEPSSTAKVLSNAVPSETHSIATQYLQSVAQMSHYFLDYPLPSSEFGKMGKRIQIMRDWILASQAIHSQISAEEARSLDFEIDTAALSLFPFIKNPTEPAYSSLSGLRQKIHPGTKAILIPTGRETFRYACHLISNLRNTLGSKIPIEIFYAGDEDLPADYRAFITDMGKDIRTIDITKVLDDTTLDLKHGGWAIKAFSVIASESEQVILADADAVLLQAPETIFEQHSGYKDTGTLLFRDRLLWKGWFKRRHEWWKAQLEHHKPSKALSLNRAYQEDYAEECDSGIVALDKSRLEVLLGILHICWQNTKEVRERWTYNMTHGDKESWWFGLELAGVEYTFEEHYGGIVGHYHEDEEKICGFTIAHTDDRGKLLWYNGSLLKNKIRNATEFDIPRHWMLDGEWQKGAKEDLSCVVKGTVREISENERNILEGSVDHAKRLDKKIEEFTVL